MAWQLNGVILDYGPSYQDDMRLESYKNIELSYPSKTMRNSFLFLKEYDFPRTITWDIATESLKNKLIQIPKIVNIQNKFGWTPIIVAIYNNHKEIIKTLLINGAELSICNFKGTTPLMYAKSAYMKYRDSEILELLLEFDFDIYQKDYSDKNILDYCVENNEIEVLNIIKESIK